MARGFVRKRGDVYYAYWRDPTGRQRSKAVGSRKKDAEAFLARIAADLVDGSYRDLRPITFEDFARMWLTDYAEVQVKPSTLVNYQPMTNRSLIPYFGAAKLTEIGTAEVQRYVAQLSRGRKPATVRKHLTMLKTMLRQAVEWGYLKYNPATPVKPPRDEHHEMEFMTPSEIHTFLAAVEPTFYRALFATAILTGMRLGELLALMWDDIDWNRGIIRVRRSVWRGQFQDPKSRRSVRNVLLTPTLASILLAHKTQAPANPDDLVFTTPEGQPIDQANLRHRVFEASLRRAGMRKMRIHDLRHTFASLLINEGENLKFVQQQLGHASIQTTVDRYGHLMPDAHIGAAQRLDAAVFGTRPENLDDKSLTGSPDNETGRKSVDLRPASVLVAGAGFEPATFGL